MIDTVFAEIEIGGGEPVKPEPLPPIRAQVRRAPGAGELNAAAPQTLAPDPYRALFSRMRALGSYAGDRNALFYKRGERKELSGVFLKQAELMKDVTDDFQEQAAFNVYYPYYQLMDYAQLRTYFTWRTRVKNGEDADAPASYAFLYIYELLNNVGTDGPEDGLKRLSDFRRRYGARDKTIDKYMLRWLKDYHVYYDVETPFARFIREQNIDALYTDIYDVRAGENFDFYAAMSRYALRESAFYTPDSAALLEECCLRVIERLKQSLTQISFDDILFKPRGGGQVWHPFDGALFVCGRGLPDKRVILSDSEIYIRRRDVWTRRAVTDGNRALITYLFRRTESALRAVSGYKHKLTVNPGILDRETVSVFDTAGVPLEALIDGVARERWAEANRVVVTVNPASLNKIRAEARGTQERLTVEPDARPPDIMPEVKPAVNKPPPSAENGLAAFARSLDPTEAAGLRVILNGGDFNAFAVDSGAMPEIIADSINQKAYEILQDNIMELDGAVAVYQEYADALSQCLTTIEYERPRI